MSSPGDRLRAIASHVCSLRAMERVLDPAIADLRWEYHDARRRQRQWRAKWIRVTGSLTVLYLIATHVHVGSIALTPRNAAPSMRVLAGSASVVAVMTAALIAIGISNVPFPIVERGWLVFYLLPSTLPLTVPYGFAVAAAWGRAGASWQKAPRLLGGAAVLSLLAFATIGWITPAANQAYRVTAARQQVRLGFNELTLPELRRLLAAERERPSGLLGFASDPVYPTIQLRAAEYSYHGRLAASFASLALGLFVLGISSLTRGARIGGVIAILGLYFTWYGAMRSPVQTFATLSPALVAWLPNITVLGAAVLSRGLSSAGSGDERRG
jgi:hypothetical protein